MSSGRALASRSANPISGLKAVQDASTGCGTMADYDPFGSGGFPQSPPGPWHTSPVVAAFGRHPRRSLGIADPIASAGSRTPS